jgi:hypothetical protein
LFNAQDLNAMIDAAKYADLVLLLIDGAFGFEMETFEFLNMLQVCICFSLIMLQYGLVHRVMPGMANDHDAKCFWSFVVYMIHSTGGFRYQVRTQGHEVQTSP